MFEFDEADKDARKEFQKQAVSAAITISGLWYFDIKVLNRTSWGMAMGPLRKFALINALSIPFYWYFMTNVRQAHMDMKRHLVTKYLIQGGEVLYKRRLKD